MPDGELRLTTWQKTRGLFAAAIVGLLLTILTDVGWPVFMTWFADQYLGYTGYVAPFSQVWAWVVLYAIFGLPVALICCFAVGFPVWNSAERKGLRTFGDAFRFGARCGLIISLIGIGLGLFFGLKTALDDTSSFNSWSWGGQVINDGLPTPLGWAYQLLDLLVTIITGAIAGLIAWKVAGPARARPHSQANETRLPTP